MLGLVLRQGSWALYALALLEGLQLLGGVSGSRWWIAVLLVLLGSIAGSLARAARNAATWSQVDDLKSS